jgi:predicted ATPase/class 3 adenylate cyclase
MLLACEALAVGVGAPSGTVTFLFTDVEGSTRLWQADEAAMREALERHDTIVRSAIEGRGGYVFSTGGDGFGAAFARAGEAVAAAIDAQATLAGEAWPEQAPIRVRMALHTGEVAERDGDYFGTPVNQTARLVAVGHGGQVLCSQVTAGLVGADVKVVDLGEHRLRDLSRPQRVFQLLAPGLPANFPRLVSLEVSPTNLPVQLTSFVGRDAELKALGDLLAEHRMVTLTGTGGVGKTRLAIHLAAELLDRYRDGVWLVELASVEPARVVEVMAGAVGVAVQPGRTFEECLIDELRDRALVVVLDNCEHLVREVRRVAEIVLREARGVSLLATSREGLRVSGEQLFSVPSLDDDAAVSLFVERASAADSAFTLYDHDRVALLSICARLDGIPLAIELAAARVRMFSVADLAQRVNQRFRLLTGGRGGVERHQTLRAAIDWSYELLSPVERVALVRFAVFAGGCTLDAAEAVIADTDVAANEVLDLLSGLVDKSLVVVDRTHSQTRYDVLETIRQYAQERLVDSGDAEGVRARHARWYADFARAAGRGLYSPDEAMWLERLRAEVDNLQVAVSWSVGAEQTELAMRLGGAFPRQAMGRPLLGTASLAEQAMGVQGAGRHPLRARVLAEAAWAAYARGDHTTARRRLDESTDAQRNGARYSAAAYSYLLSMGPPDAYNIAKEGLAGAEAAGDILGAIGSRIAFAIHAMVFEHDDEALSHAQRALGEARQLRQPTLEAAALYANAVALANADPASAMRLARESLDLTRHLGIESERVTALALLAALEARHGDAHRGLEALQEQLRSSTSFLYGSLGTDLYYETELLNRVGRPDLVARCYGVSRQLQRSMGPLYAKMREQAIQNAKATLGENAFDEQATEGAAMPPEQFREMLLREIEGLLATTPNG